MMSSRIARLLIGMAVAVAIVPLGIGAVEAGRAHPGRAYGWQQRGPPDQPLRIAGLRDRRALRRTPRSPRSPRDRAVGVDVLSRKFSYARRPPRPSAADLKFHHCGC